MLGKLKKFNRLLKHAALVMINIPDYEAYIQHHQKHHPDQPLLSYRDFFQTRQKAQYGKNKHGCC